MTAINSELIIDGNILRKNISYIKDNQKNSLLLNWLIGLILYILIIDIIDTNIQGHK